MVQREQRRVRMVARYAVKRAALKEIIASSASSYEERVSALEKLQKMPRDSAKVRLRNRCARTGRPKGFYRKFGLARNKLREAAMRGDVPGLVKASW